MCKLGINPLSVVSFAIISSHSEGCLFTLLIVLFAVQKLLSVIRSHMFTFVFNVHYSRMWVVKDLALIYVIGELLFISVLGLLVAVASLVAERGP